MMINHAKIALVIPTIRDLRFLRLWTKQLSGCHLIVVEDRQEPTTKILQGEFASVTRFGWKDIDADLQENSWIISRRNAGIRCYGFWKAWQMGAEVILTLDDDCYPTTDPLLEGHLDSLQFKSASSWLPTYPHPQWLYTRGFPYSVRQQNPVMVSHGLWSGALDLDAKTENQLPRLLDEPAYPPLRQIIPAGYFYPMCSMNLAFRKEVAVLMFFPMMGSQPSGKSWPYDRFDDIWAGILAKKILDHLGFAVVNGSPFIEHRKKSKIKENLQKEASGAKINEVFWQKVVKVQLTQKNPKSCYLELAQKIDFPKNNYFTKLREAMIIWANLF